MKNCPNFLIIALVLTVSMLTASATAQQQTENWIGVLDVGGAKLRLELKIEKASEGSPSGALISLDQGNVTIPFDELDLSDNKLKFKIERIRAEFEGERNKSGDQITGVFTQLGRKTKITFERKDQSSIGSYVECWQGTMVAGHRVFEFQLRIFETPDGTRTGFLDSLGEHLSDLPITLNEKDDFEFELPSTKATYQGIFSEDRKKITGKWKQAGGEFDLIFKSIPVENTKTHDVNRPQTPKPPFDYLSTNFEVKSKISEGVKLAGTLTKPKGDGPFPAAILISGSGAQDRDCNIYGHKSFLVIADHFAKHGIAVLRYDERGVAESEGDFSKATSRDFANDVNELLDWLKQQPSIDPKKLVVIGHSEGGIVGPMVAADRDDVDKLVILAGPFVTGERIILNQTRKIAAATGAIPQFLDAQDTLMEKVLAHVKQGNDLTREFVDKAVEEVNAGLSDEDKGNFVFPDSARAALARLSTPWSKFFVTYDPVPTFEQVTCPVLIITGDKDLQVDPDLNLPIAEKILSRRANKDWEIVRPEKLNHLFQASETGHPIEYASLDETFSTIVLDKMVSWITGK